MDSFEFNKFAGAVLFTLLVTVGVGIVAEEIFTPHHPETPGYEVAVTEQGAPGEPEAESEEVIPLPELLAAADVEKGESQARKCQSCHDFTQGGPNKVGPNLWGVVGRTIGTHEGFNYSDAMKEHAAKGDTWTYENLNKFIENPKGFIPGTAMAFAGIKKPEDRADLFAYLQTLSDNPVPFPTAAAQPAGEQQEGGGEQQGGEQQQGGAAPQGGGQPGEAAKEGESKAPPASTN